MNELKLRGFVSPEDFSGSDSEKIQQALDTSCKEDIGKVIIEGKYTLDKTVVVYSKTEVIFKNAEISVSGDFPIITNDAAVNKQKAISFEDDLIYIKGENAVLNGDLSFYNGKRIVVEKMTVNGTVFFEFCRWARIEYVDFFAKNAVVLCRGCNSSIFQYISAKTSETAFVMDTSLEKNEYCVGKDADIHEIILRSSSVDSAAPAVTLDATETTGFFNDVIDTIKTDAQPVVISGKAGNLNCERYRDLTVNNFDSSVQPAVIVNSDVKHCCFDNL